jgi:hypothetical protein
MHIQIPAIHNTKKKLAISAKKIRYFVMHLVLFQFHKS